MSTFSRAKGNSILAAEVGGVRSENWGHGGLGFLLPSAHHP